MSDPDDGKNLRSRLLLSRYKDAYRVAAAIVVGGTVIKWAGVGVAIVGTFVGTAGDGPLNVVVLIPSLVVGALAAALWRLFRGPCRHPPPSPGLSAYSSPLPTEDV